MDNKQRYNGEREKRWMMAKKKEPEAIAAICRILEGASGHQVRNERYDELWFKEFKLDLPEWVKGASDYVLSIDHERYVYAEIKLKSVKFQKTRYGGTTRRGSVIAKYGCESFYLDIVPVYRNMCAFAQETGIDSRNFIIFFVNEELTEVHAISLEEIQRLVKYGYKGKPLCVYTEGYGTDTEYGAAPNYLIPENATRLLNFEYIEQHSTPNVVIPRPTIQK